MINSLCVILARKGSKGIKGKNIVNINDKPLIAHTIEAAIKSNQFDNVVVSTDCNDILEISNKYGASTPFMRPDYLSGDHVLSKVALRHAVEQSEIIYNKKFDIVAELQCTSPLRSHRHVLEAMQLFLKNKEKIDSVVSLREVNHFHPKKIKKLKDGIVEALCDHYIENQIGRRQDSQSFYIRNGAIFIMHRNCLFEKNSRVGDTTMGYVMDEISSINIDSLLDLKLAKVIMEE